MTRNFHLSPGIILALFAMLVFCINDGMYKYVLAFTAPEVAITFGFAFSVFFLIVYTAIRRISLKPQKKRNIAIFAVFFLVEQALFLYALKHLPMAELFVVLLAAPVFVLMLSGLILKEHLTRPQVFAILCGFLGALIVVAAPLLGKNADGQDTNVLAWMCAILNFVCNGSKIIYMRKYCRDENNFAMSIAASALLALTFGTFVNWPVLDITPSLWAWTGAIGLCSAIGFIAYVRAFQIEKAALVSATQYSQILWATLMGVFIFREELTSAAIAGILLILTSGYFLYFKRPGSAS